MGQTRGQKAMKQTESFLAIDILGLPEIAEWMRKSPKIMRPVLRSAMHASVLHIKSKVMDKLNNDVLQRRTGMYHRSINTKVRLHDNGRAYYGVVGTHVKYARVHEFGATIKPKNEDGYLVFKTPDGKRVRTKQVKIPARPIWKPVFEKERPRVMKLHQEATHKMLQKAGKGSAVSASRVREL